MSAVAEDGPPRATRRVLCETCQRPASACICAWIRPTANEAEVLVLQHPLEVTQAKGSAKLLTLSLRACTVLVGEVFSPEILRDHLWRPTRDGRALSPILLYPGAGVSIDQPDSKAGPTALRLVVIDATWKKSLRMLHHNPPLHALPRLSLDDARPSRYAIRKAPHAGQLSTLEATCHALAQLTSDGHRYAPLLEAFDGFVATHGARMAEGRAAS